MAEYPLVTAEWCGEGESEMIIGDGWMVSELVGVEAGHGQGRRGNVVYGARHSVSGEFKGRVDLIAG